MSKEEGNQMESKIIAYKAFDENLSCRGFQYELGKSYKHKGKVSACNGGFHACLNPFDCWHYYSLTESRFAEVELSGKTDAHEGDTKIAAAKIHIKAELKLPEFIERGIKWILESVSASDPDDNEDAQIGSSGYSAKIGSSGDYAKIGSSGDYAQIGSSGYSAQIGSSGCSAKIGSSGCSAQIGSSGDYAQIGSSGCSAKIGSSGYSAQIGSSGDSAKIGSSGDSAQIGSSGCSAKIGSSGYSAKIGSSGYSAKIEATGKKSVIASAGINTRAKGANGTWISLAEFNDDGECVGFAVGCIGADGLKEDVWYVAKEGKLLEKN